MSTDTVAPDAPVEVADEVVDIAEFKDGKPLVAYTRTERALAELRLQFEGAKFDLTTTAGDRAARAARLALVTLRNDLERRRKAFKAPALEFGRLIDDEAKRIHSQIVALEQPIDAQIVADEKRRREEREAREAAERERLAKLRTRIDYMRGVAARAAGKPSSEVRSKLDMMRTVTIGEDFGDLRAEAQQVHEEVLHTLGEMMVAVEAQEIEAARIAAERAAFERRQAMNARLTEISKMADGMARKGSAEIEQAIERVRAVDTSDEAWGEYKDSAVHAAACVLVDLRAMLDDAKHLERVAAEQAAEAQRQAQQRAELEAREQIQSIADAEAAVTKATSEKIGQALAFMETWANAKMGSDAVQEARWAAIMRLRAHRAMTAAKEADALRAEQELRDNAAAQNSQRQESGAQPDPNATGTGNMAHNTADAAPGGGRAEGEAAVPAAVSPGSRTAEDQARESPASNGAGEPAGEIIGITSDRAEIERAMCDDAPDPAPVQAAPAEDPPSIKLGELCAEVGEGFKMTEAFVSGVLNVPCTKGERGAVLYTQAQRRQILRALGARCHALVGDAS